ncbi:Uma2 family endonuclease, partial [Prochlorothrix hollandica]|uniref:Uma2 family endonuclease n=1 Tax=Prochlorothrix hollandica TaxID=1223 RepID=UPI003341100F
MAEFSVQLMPTDQPLVLEMPPGELWSDEPPLESDLHREHIERLLRLLKWHWRDRTDYYASGNLTIYYNPKQLKSRDFRGPDFFVVLGAENRSRNSWVVWEERDQYPHVIIELLSESTATVDRGLKKQLYQDVFRTPHYFWFHPRTLELAGFELVQGQYQAIPANAEGHLWCESLGLFVGLADRSLWFFTAAGDRVLLPEESAAQQAQAAAQREQATAQRAQAAAQQAQAAAQQAQAAA